jgi:hypothetical protein
LAQLQHTLKLVDHFSKSNQQIKKLKHQQKNMDTYDEKNNLLVWWLMLSQDGGLLTLCVKD